MEQKSFCLGKAATSATATARLGIFAAWPKRADEGGGPTPGRIPYRSGCNLHCRISRDSLMAEIKFGTSGWRAVLAEDFTFGNARRVVEAIARVLTADGRKG